MLPSALTNGAKSTPLTTPAGPERAAASYAAKIFFFRSSAERRHCCRQSSAVYDSVSEGVEGGVTNRSDLNKNNEKISLRTC